MDLQPDELAGVVDLFGSLTRAELLDACGELAFKQGIDDDPEVVAAAIDDAIDSYHLVTVDDHAADADETLLVVGPVAFPALPDGAADLPHIMDVPARDLARDAVIEAIKARFREDAVMAVKNGDEDRVGTLLDVSYDIEAWENVEMDGLRDRLDDV
ncbi:DUF7109 family protein [Haloarcula japonica]|uniref:Uncharacterized protein n=1 Tax=Haloarcula japonica (strain ATCC 49778 / DSM 6131 / JCM 7785 / NBRC 101032 / NCIMB 13157 / TR-1) TaxID=1227453 RepID=M0LJL4_HALJT|nr:hypothetical protein [Haloarcula japonica]EMA33721.1 hypothetical protein C444_04772 [Haloarcula japonica DSM 6131]